MRDVLVSRSGCGLAALPVGATVGTSSRRRAAQIRVRYPHLQMLDIRGNVDTRVRKVLDPTGPYDATILAYAGLERLGRSDVISEILPLDLMLPAPGQGALAVQCRDEAVLLARLAPLGRCGHTCGGHSGACVSGRVGRRLCRAGCGACAVQRRANHRARARGCCAMGRAWSRWRWRDRPARRRRLGAELARLALAQGADLLLQEPDPDGASVALAGKRVVVTQAVHQAPELCDLLRGAGAKPLLLSRVLRLSRPPTRPNWMRLCALQRRVATTGWW